MSVFYFVLFFKDIVSLGDHFCFLVQSTDEQKNIKHFAFLSEVNDKLILMYQRWNERNFFIIQRAFNVDQ